MKKSNGWVSAAKHPEIGTVRASFHAEQGTEIVSGKKGQGWTVILLGLDGNVRSVGSGKTQDDALAVAWADAA